MTERMSDEEFLTISQLIENLPIVKEAIRAREAEKDWERLCDEADVLMSDMLMEIEELKKKTLG